MCVFFFFVLVYVFVVYAAAVETVAEVASLWSSDTRLFTLTTKIISQADTRKKYFLGYYFCCWQYFLCFYAYVVFDVGSYRTQHRRIRQQTPVHT